MTPFTATIAAAAGPSRANHSTVKPAMCVCVKNWKTITCADPTRATKDACSALRLYSVALTCCCVHMLCILDVPKIWLKVASATVQFVTILCHGPSVNEQHLYATNVLLFTICAPNYSKANRVGWKNGTLILLMNIFTFFWKFQRS